MEFLRWIIGFIFAIFLAGFAVLNIHSVSLVWSPVHEPLDLPLYMIALPLMALGFICGGFIVWLNNAPARRTKRKQSKQIKALEKEVKYFNKKNKDKLPSSYFFPLLPDNIKNDHKKP